MLAPGVKVWASRNSWEHETFLCAAVYTAHNLPCVSALGHWLSRRRLLLLNTEHKPCSEAPQSTFEVGARQEDIEVLTGN